MVVKDSEGEEEAKDRSVNKVAKEVSSSEDEDSQKEYSEQVDSSVGSCSVTGE